MNRIRHWLLRRDDHSGVLIGAGGERQSDWHCQRTCWLMTQARESIDSPHAKTDRLHACTHKWQLAATKYSRLGGGGAFVEEVYI